MQAAKRRYFHWGRHEDDLIAAMFPESSDREIAERLGRGKDGVIKRRHELGLMRREARGGHEDAYPDNWQADAVRGSQMLLEALRAVQ